MNARLPVPAVFLALEKIIEKPLLQLAAVIRVEMRPVLDAVHLEPLLFGSRADERFDVSTQMQALTAPVAGRKKRHRDAIEDRRARLVIVVVQRMRENVRAEIATVFLQLRF